MKYLLVIFFLLAGKVSAQSSDKMLYPDSTTKFVDTAGNTISQAQFMSAMATGQYTFEPKLDNGKMVSISLKKTVSKLNVGSILPDIRTGKITIINCWFIHCAGCLEEMPKLNELAEKYKNDTNVVFVAVTYDKAADVNAFLKKKPFKYQQLTDQKEMLDQWGIAVYPTHLVLDAEGRIVYKAVTSDAAGVDRIDQLITTLKSH
jgi:thiol-disulfide isomerase/thioredoxin